MTMTSISYVFFFFFLFAISYLTLLTSVSVEDVILVIPVEMYTEKGRTEKWKRIGNLNMWKWLTIEQVYMLNKLYKKTGDIALVLEKTYAQLLMTDGGLREMVSKGANFRFQNSSNFTSLNFYHIGLYSI